MLDINATAAGLTEGGLAHDVAIGEEASRIWKDPITQKCVEGIRKKYLDEILASKIDDVETREKAFRMIRALDDLAGEFSALIDRGEMAKARRPRKQ